jgi:hypothetical protein
MTNLLDLPLDQFRGYLAEGNYPQARQDELMRAYRAKNSLAGWLDRYGEDAYKGRLGLLGDGNMNVSSYFPVAVPEGMTIWEGLKSGRFQTRFKDYASDALGGVLNALNNPRDSYQGTLPQADYDSAAMGTAGLAMVGGDVVAGRLPDGAVAANIPVMQGRSRQGLTDFFNPDGVSWGTDSKSTAEQFAGKDAGLVYKYNDEGKLEVSEADSYLPGQVYDLNYDLENPMQVPIKDTLWTQEKELAKIAEAKAKGHDGLKIVHGTPDADGKYPKTDYVAFDPSQVSTVNANASKSAGLLAAGLPDPRNAGEAMDFEKDLFWGEKDGENFIYKKTPDLSNDLAEVVAKKLNNIDGIEADVGTSNISASSYVKVNFGTVDADGDIEPFEEFKLRFSDHPDRYGANKTIRFDEAADDIYEFDEYVETRVNKENLQEMLEDGIGSVLSFGKSKAAEASKEGYLTDIELSKFLKDLEKPINANASAPVGLLAAQPSTEDELRQHLMQRGLLQ